MLMFINYVLMAIIGYFIGRVSHIYGGDLPGPHHWIFGVLFFLPAVFFDHYLILLLSYLGVGLFVSDLKDFVDMKFWGVDDVKIKRFWGID